MAVTHVLVTDGEWLITALVMAAALPQVAASWQFLLVAGHFRHQRGGLRAPAFPRLAVVIPAWNEGAVIGASIDGLLAADYPPQRLRVYVVDDASTDDTPEVVKAKEAQYPGRVVHLRREHGGQGKAHTLNHGLAVILGQDWMEALLITDADVIFEPACLRTMTCHLADPGIGAVTAYIKEGSRPGNYLTRFVGYEYITAQAAARRGQNVLGAVACLAGGAQLHSRANLVTLGGRIDTTSLAEDTITTFETQLRGRRVLFEPHAVCWAEEPGSVRALWKQRLRWARGNIQVTRRYRWLWFRPGRAHRLGSVSFGAFWFCLLLQPLFMIISSASLLILYFAGAAQVWAAFRLLWIINAVAYLFITGFALLIDPPTGRRTWRQALLFPGAVNLGVIVCTCFPRLWRDAIAWLAGESHVSLDHLGWGIPLIYAWIAGSMAVAYAAKVIESRWLGRLFSPILVYLAGYGALLCACAMAAYLKEMTGAEQKWDKTEKTGKVTIPT